MGAGIILPVHTARTSNCGLMLHVFLLQI